MLGDSTMQFNDCTTYPQTGWGQVAGLFFSRKVAIFNYAKNGRSTKSFIDEKRLAEVEPLLRKGDYVIIQFGHNDEKEDEARRTEPFSTYKENLAQFVSVAKKAGAYPILLSSISRRSFDERGKIKDTHGDYPRAMKAFAQDNGLPFVDMNALTTDFLNNLGETKSRDLFMNFDSGICLEDLRLYAGVFGKEKEKVEPTKPAQPSKDGSVSNFIGLILLIIGFLF